MKKRMSRKLQLNRETLRDLNDASLANVEGGGTTQPCTSQKCAETITCDTCWYSCNETVCGC